MACDLFAGFCLSCLCAMCSHANLSWPHPSCYLIIDLFVPPVPRYPPQLLPLKSPCVCSPMLVHCCMPCVLSCPVLSCPVLSCPVLSCPVLSCPVLSCPVLSCPVLSCPVLSCPVLPCPVLSCPASLFFPYGVVFVCFFYIIKNPFSLLHLSPRLHPFSVPDIKGWIQTEACVIPSYH